MSAKCKGTRIVQTDSGSDSDSESRNLNLPALYAYPNTSGAFAVSFPRDLN